MAFYIYLFTTPQFVCCLSIIKSVKEPDVFENAIGHLAEVETLCLCAGVLMFYGLNQKRIRDTSLARAMFSKGTVFLLVKVFLL